MTYDDLRVWAFLAGFASILLGFLIAIFGKGFLNVWRTTFGGENE